MELKKPGRISESLQWNHKPLGRITESPSGIIILLMFIYMLILFNINIFMLILTLIKFIKSSMVSYRASNA